MKKVLLVLLISIVFIPQLWAITYGKVVEITGEEKLYMKKTKAETGILLKKDDPVNLDHFIQSGKNTEAVIRLDYDGMNTTIKVRENSLIKLVSRINDKTKNGVFLFFGRQYNIFKGQKEKGYAVETLNSVAGVEGTEFEVSYNKKLVQTILRVISGKVRFSAKKGVLPGLPPQVKHVGKDQIGVVEKNNSIKLIDDSTLKEFKFYLDEMSLASAGYKKEKIKKVETDEYENTETVLLSPDEEKELFCDDEDGITLTFKLMGSEKADFKNSSVLDCKAYVWIDECNFYKGKKLTYSSSKNIRIEKISRNIHSVTVLCGGYQHTFDLDLSDISGNFHEETIYYFMKNYALRPLPDESRIEPDVIISDFEIIMNGQPLQLKKGMRNFGFEPKWTFIDNFSKRVKFYFPISERYFTISIKSEKYQHRRIELDLEHLENLKSKMGTSRSIHLRKKKK